MPAVSTITLNDGETTPVAHIFEPVRTSADSAHFEDKSPSQYIGFWKMNVALRRPQGPAKVASRNLEATFRIETPVLEVLGNSDAGFTPAPTVAYRPFVEVRYVLPERSSFQQRKNLRYLAYNFMGTGVCTDLVDNLRVPY